MFPLSRCASTEVLHTEVSTKLGLTEAAQRSFCTQPFTRRRFQVHSGNRNLIAFGKHAAMERWPQGSLMRTLGLWVEAGGRRSRTDSGSKIMHTRYPKHLEATVARTRNQNGHGPHLPHPGATLHRRLQPFDTKNIMSCAPSQKVTTSQSYRF